MVQANLLPAPAGLGHDALLSRWHSLADIAGIVAAGGTRVTVVQASRQEGRLLRDGIEYWFLDVAGARGAPDRARRLATWLADARPDLLHVHGLAFAEDAFALSRLLPGLPILCQDHADRPPRGWRRWRWKRAFSAVSAVAFTAAAQAWPFVAAGVFSGAMPVFAIPESSSRFGTGDRGAARAATGVHGDPAVLWVGHLDRNKDPLTVIDGIARAASRLPGLQFWCASGTWPLLGEVRARIAAHPQLAGRVHLLGKVGRSSVEQLMRAADVFVSGSHAEGCGYALLEALACGATPVVSDIPAFRALTGDGAIGRLWPAGDARGLARALEQAVADPPPPGQVRRHFDAVLSFPALGRRWTDAYARVAASRAGRAA